MKFFFYIFVFSTLVLGSASCSQMPNDGIPFYMKMDSAKVVITDANKQGTSTRTNIVDVWIEANTDNVGAFELPCNVPILQENATRFVVSAGIKESGQSSIRVVYPFYDVDTFTINAVPGQKYTHQPVFKYRDGLKYPFDCEDFDDGVGFSNMERVTEGSEQCGKITMLVDSFLECKQINRYDLPEGTDIWLEVDYKGDLPFFIGIYGYYNAGDEYRYPILYIPEKANWNKIYVKLSNYVGQLDAATYYLYFEALRPLGNTGTSVFLDNIKIVHY